MSFNFDNYPLIIINFNNNFFKNHNMFSIYEQLLHKTLQGNNKNKLKIIFNLEKCNETPPLSYLLYHGKFMIQHDNLYKQSICKTAIILPFDSWKTFVNTLFKIKKPQMPNIICSTMRNAILFCQQE